MGINGLLPLLKSIHKPCSLKKFEGKTLGVDAYGWLHRGTVACAMELAMGKQTKKFVEFSMHRVRMLQHFGVIPFLIFDGDYLPSKAATEDDRSKRRDASKKAGLELLNAGKTSQAYLEFQKCVDVTPEMARQVIEELKKAGVQYIVAPYEADAQMVYLERKGIVDGILSEDSDLLVFGAKCLLTKLDQYGNCIEVNKADFSACREINLAGWSDKEFRIMAILSGCDYLSSINNMGLKTAYRMVRKHKTIEKVIRMLQFDGKFSVPKGYLEAFNQAELTFLHQRVFCPEAQCLVLHTKPTHSPEEVENMPFIGAPVDPKIARGIATGELNPMTKLPIVLINTKDIGHTMASPRNPSTPWSSRSQGQRSVSAQTNDPKGQPIDTFFRPKRIPLAELDVNCFTPSPSQQEALSRNAGPWAASPALMPRPYINRSVSNPHLPQSVTTPQLPQSSNAPRLSRSTTSSQVPQSVHSPRQSPVRPRAPTFSEVRPPTKRMRLCSDIDTLLSPSEKVELSSSRFFGHSKGLEPSPTNNRRVSSRKSMRQDISIFSDDSVEEAMLSLPDVDSFATPAPRSGKKIHVFQEPTEPEDVAVLSPESPEYGVDSGTSQESAISLTESASTQSSVEQPPTPIEKTPKETTLPAGKLLKQFAFGGPSSLSTPKTYLGLGGLPTPSSSASRQSRIPRAVSGGASISGLTPLQRLGAGAANRSKLPMTPPLTPTITVKKSPRHSLLSRDSLPFPEVATDKKDMDPASVPLPETTEMEKRSLGMVSKGSEDLIIHDSESDGDSPSADHFSPIVDDAAAPKIDFRKFVYSCGSS